MKRTYLTLLITVVLGITVAVLFPYTSVTPGVLIDGHASLKNDCFSCHTIGKGAVTEKCQICHRSDGIGKMTSAGIPLPKERTKSVLIHSSANTMECYHCHTEHNGRSRESATSAFSHSILDEQKRSQCAVCHSAPTSYIHSLPSIACTKCHTTDDWKSGTFDHALLGPNVQRCTDCHTKNIPGDELHRSVVSVQQCGACHSTAAWKPSSYDHSKLFRFDNNHPSTCSDCHSPNSGFKSYTCYTCHEHSESKIAQKHQKEGIQNFSNCAKCHRSGNEHEIIGRESGGGKNREVDRSERRESENENSD
jgi:hypothetical protein